MRLKAIGNAWDLNVTGLFFPHCLRSEYTLIPGAGPQMALTVEQQEKADVLHSLYRHVGEEKFMEMLDSQYNEEGIAEAVALMALYQPKLYGACGGHDSTQTAALVNICSVLDSGSAMQIPRTVARVARFPFFRRPLDSRPLRPGLFPDKFFECGAWSVPITRVRRDRAC